MDPFDPKQLKKLRNAVEWSERKLQSFRVMRIDALQQFVGRHYGTGIEIENVPVNLIELFTTIYLRKIAVKDPQAMVDTKYAELRASAAHFGLAINQSLKRMKLEDALNIAGMESMFLMGGVKIGVDSNGEIFVDPLMFDDLVIDLSAKTWDQVGFVGHRFRIPLEDVRDNDEYDKTLRQKMTATNVVDTQPSSDGTNTRSQTLTLGESNSVEEYKDHTELVELYLPREKLVVTLPGNDSSEALCVKDWHGPTDGPYRFLKFVDVPGNILPLAPVQLWRDIHTVTNRMANKVFWQAERQKTLLGIGSGANRDGKRIVDASDGDTIPLDNPEGIKEFSTGGASSQNMGLVMWLRQLGSYMAGNADMVGGLSNATSTVGQDAMLLQSAGTQVEEMQHRMLSFARDVIKDVGWWLWTDPVRSETITREIPGTKEHYALQWDAERRIGDFMQYNLNIEPYSIVHRTPQQKLQAMLQLVQTVILPVMPAMQQAGLSIDFERFIKLTAQYADLEELSEIVIYSGGERYPAGGAPPENMGTVNPNKPNGEYTRKNVSAPHPGGFDHEMMTSLMGAGANE